MNSQRSWLCDGISKNGKRYPDIYTPHQLYENFGSHCQICGKQREVIISHQPIVRIPQPAMPHPHNINLPRPSNLSNHLQLLLLLVIPLLSVILATYVMLAPLLKNWIDLSRNYKNVNYSITIKYPKTWEVREKQDPTITGDVAILFPSEKTELDDCYATLTIAVDDFQENPPSVQEYKNSVRQKIESLNPNTKMIDESAKVMLSNSRAYRLAYSRKNEKCNLQVIEIGTIRNNKAYYITYKASNNTYDKFLKPVEAMINSLEIKELTN